MSYTAQTAVTTPNRALPAPAPAQESPGTWRHPRLIEISRRQAATTFTEKNAKRIAINIAAYAALIVLNVLLSRIMPSKQHMPKLLAQYGWYVYHALASIPLFNIAWNALPLLRPRDDLSDIALTPHQRRLLGLPPASRPPTPGSVYSTPPRYSRTPSTLGSSAGSTRRRNSSFGSSPASVSGSPVFNVSTGSGSGGGNRPLRNGGLSGSMAGAGTSTGTANLPPVFGSPSSPLLQKAMSGARRRPSIGSLGGPTSPSPSNFNASLGASTMTTATMASSLFGGAPPDSPSPTPAAAAGKRSSIGLSNKWLYEKGRERRASGNARLFI